MDYDQTVAPVGYDRGRGYAPETCDLWMGVLRASTEGRTIERIIDLGCGTGRYADILSEAYGAEILAVDPSEEMLRQAEAKALPRVTCRLGSAETIPAEDTSADMIFMSMMFHHVEDQPRALAECARVLKPGGVICMRALTADQIEHYPFVPSFPASGDLMRAGLQSATDFVQVFQRAGFRCTQHDVIDNPIAPNWKAFADKVALKPYSTLVRLSDPDFEAGLASLRRHADEMGETEPVMEPVDYFVFER